jgi:hypothetical protein
LLKIRSGLQLSAVTWELRSAKFAVDFNLNYHDEFTGWNGTDHQVKSPPFVIGFIFLLGLIAGKTELRCHLNPCFTVDNWQIPLPCSHRILNTVQELASELRRFPQAPCQGFGAEIL